MKPGDLVYTCWDEVGIVLTKPRMSADCEAPVLGVMSGDMYFVVGVLTPRGPDLFTTDEIELLVKDDESR